MTGTIWPRVRLEELATRVGSGATPRGGEAFYKKSGVPLIRSMNVVFFGFKRDGIAYLDEVQAQALEGVEVRNEDILLNITGASIGRVTLAPPDMDGARVNQHVCIIRPSDIVEARFLRAFLSSPEMQSEITTENYGVTRQALTKQQILDFEVPLPPFNEQKRIADKLDVVLAWVDACRKRLDRIPTILKRFRQAVLAAATSGKLTAEWRESNDARSNAMQPDVVDEGNLPKGWRWSYAEEIKAPDRYSLAIGPFGSNLKVADYRTEGTPLIFVREIRNRSFGGPNTKYVSKQKAEDLAAHSVTAGDLLITKMGDPPGDTAIYPLGAPDAVITADCIKLRVDEMIAHPRFVGYVIESPECRQRLQEITVGVAQQKISLERFRRFPLQLAPRDEQDEIVRRVEAFSTSADRLEARYTAARAQIERLTPALLAKAFRGELVPQDPNDEPALVLLERIRAARAMQPVKPNRLNAGRRRTMTKITVDSVKDIIRQLPEDTFSFSELRDRTATDYDTLKSIVFALLDEAEPSVKQIFDQEAQAIRFVRVLP